MVINRTTMNADERRTGGASRRRRDGRRSRGTERKNRVSE